MALPAYANDMITIATGDLNFDLGTFDESSDAGWDTAGAMVDDENAWYVDTLINTGEPTSSCTSAQYTKDGTGAGTSGPGTIMYLHTTAFTVPVDGIVSIDNFWAAPPALNPYAGTFLVAEAGVSVLIGTTLGDFDVHYVAGSDLYPATDGVYTTYFVDPTVTPAGTVGTVTTTNMVGIAIAAGPQARGNPNAIQSVRYGRAEVEYTLGDAVTPATFEGYAVIDNSLADKFNLLLYIEGGYKARGLMTFGTAATPVYFEDSDITISIADDLKVSPNFNKGVVNNALSEQHWNNVKITNLGTVARYIYQANDGALTRHNAGCVFTGVGTFTYGTGGIQTGVGYVKAEPVTQGGSSFVDCKFDKPTNTVGLYADALDLVDACLFTSSGSNYGVDIGTIPATVSLSWKNTEALHVVGTTGTNVGVTPTGNETILVSVDAGQILTINVGTGASIPSVANAGTGTVNVVAGLVTADWTINPNITGFEYAMYTVTASGSLVGAVEVQHVESTVTNIFSYTYTYSAGIVLAVQILDDGTNDFKESVSYYPLSTNNQSFTINLNEDTNN